MATDRYSGRKKTKRAARGLRTPRPAKAKPRNRSAQDTTLINLRVVKRRLDTLEHAARMTQLWMEGTDVILEELRRNTAPLSIMGARVILLEDAVKALTSRVGGE